MDLITTMTRRKIPLHSNQFSILLLLLTSSLISLTNGKPIVNGTTVDPPEVKSVVKLLPDSISTSSSSSHENSAERMKRQLFRDQIPHHRPLSGNLYARHHGYPHPGRWHTNPQQILQPNYDSGLHFENPNVILNDEDFNRYGSTLQHIDDHRIQTNPQPILHEYPTEYGTVVPLDQGQQGHHTSLPIPLIATHHHFHNHQGTTGSYEQQSFQQQQPQQYDQLEHGHGVIHDVGGDYGQNSHSDKYSQSTSITKSKPFFGIKFPYFFTHKSFNVPPFLKGLWPGRYGSSSSSYKRKGNPISWTSVQRSK